MNIDEAYKCPNCGKQEVNIDGMEQIFDDARSEVAICRHCNAAWRVYYKMTDINVKVLHMPEKAPEEETTEAVEVEADGTIAALSTSVNEPELVEVDTEELTENHVVSDDGIKPGI